MAWVEELTTQFEPTRENGPSSSVGDLFDSFRSASDFLAALNWPDEYQLAQFSTKLAKVSLACSFAPALCPGRPKRWERVTHGNLSLQAPACVCAPTSRPSTDRIDVQLVH
jgi:hypothetical protein